MSVFREELWSQGYTILKGLYTPEEISNARQTAQEYFATHTTLENANGRILPNFQDTAELAAVTALRKKPELESILNECFWGGPWRFCGHSDIAVNRVVSGWHKDILNGNYAHYMKRDPWTAGPAGEPYAIVKLGIYLQDHSKDPNALQVVPGSNLRRETGTAGALRLQPALGDAILFDQRITHRGMEKQIPGSRIMVSFGFGAENCFTDWFEAGTRARQADQLRAL